MKPKSNCTLVEPKRLVNGQLVAGKRKPVSRAWAARYLMSCRKVGALSATTHGRLLHATACRSSAWFQAADPVIILSGRSMPSGSARSQLGAG
jgi:hypothetical protein